MKVKYPPLKTRCGKWDFMHWYDIPSSVNPGHVYLRRLRIIQTPWFCLMIHKIYEPDDGRWPHDHPWTWFRTFILRGGYLSDNYADYSHFVNDRVEHRTYGAWSCHKMTWQEGHKITHVDPQTVTLILTGKRIRKFCFWTPERKVPYDKMRANI